MLLNYHLTEQDWLDGKKPSTYNPEHLSLADTYEAMTLIANATPIKVGKKVVIGRDTQVDAYIGQFPKLARLYSFLLNRFIITNLAKAKLSKKLNETVEASDILTNFEDFLSFLEHKADGTDQSVKTVQLFMNQQDPKYHDFLVKIASKSYKSGIAITNYNKIADKHGYESVPDFNVQLADNISKVLDKFKANTASYQEKVKLGKKAKPPVFNLVGNVYATEKFDGVRCIAMIANGKARFYTRDGREITKLLELTKELESLPFGDRVFDGELMIDTETNQEVRAEDAFRATMKIVGSKNDKVGLVYHVFDTLQSPERFLTGEATLPYKSRREWLDSHQIELNNLNHVLVAPVLKRFKIENTDDLEPIHELASEVFGRGGEGIMLNYSETLYEFKRTRSLLKVKQFSENDGEIVGTFMGQGEFEGMLGGVIVRYKDTTVRVGSGFEKEDRIKYAKNPEQLIGKMATYAFTTESHNEKGELSVRFPRFKSLRIDKTPQDASYDN